VVEAARLQPWERRDSRRFRCTYPHLRQVEYLLERHGLASLERTFEGEGARWEVQGTAERLEAFFAEAKGLVHPE
jgi:putative IMPACT (imprinted ancient) family translation regulator